MRRIAFVLISILFVQAAAQGNVPITADTAAEVVLFGSFGTSAAVTAAFSPNGKLVAVASLAGVKLYETAAFDGEDSFDGGLFPAIGVAFSPDGSMLAGVGIGYNVRLFDVDSGALTWDEYPDALGALSAVAYHPSGETGAIANDEAISIYNMADRSLRGQLTGPEATMPQIAYSADGTRLAAASYDGTAWVWDTDTGEAVATMRGHTDSLTTVSFSPDGATVLTSSYDGTARLWDTKSGEELSVLFTHEGGGEMAAAFRPDGEVFAVTTHHGEIYEVAVDSGEIVTTLSENGDSVRSVAYSPDGSMLVAVRRGLVELWDVESVALIGAATFDPSFDALALNGDGTRLAVAGANGRVQVYDTGDYRLITTFEASEAPVTALGYGAGSDTLYVGSHGGAIETVDGDGNPGMTFDTTGPVVGLTLHPESALMNAAMADGALRWWETSTGEEFGTAYTHDGALRATAFSPDGVWMASADDSGEIIVWDVEAGDVSFVIDGAGAPVRSVAFSMDGSMLAVGLDDGRATLWPTDDPSEAVSELGGFFGAVTAVAFNADGTLIGATSDDGTVRLFNRSGGEAVWTGYAHNAPVTAIAFSADGTRMYTAGQNGLALVWGVP